MSSKTIKLIIVLTLNWIAGVLPVVAQFDIDWTGLATGAINESARSDVQKVFQSLSTINFSDSKLSSFRKEGERMGLKRPTTVEALMLFEHGIRPLEASPFPLLVNQKISTIGNGVFRNLGNNMLEDIRNDLAKNEISDYLSEYALNELRAIDVDGSLEMQLQKNMTPQFALLLNNRPECLELLKQQSALLNFGYLPILPYFTSKATAHSDKFKKGSVPIISNWDFAMQNNDVLMVSSQSGEIGRVRRIDNQLLIDITGDPQWLNCNLPASAIINFGSSSLITDKLGRITEINFTPLKSKFKDANKRQLKSKDILNAKGETDRKSFMIIPKNYGGTETWNNVYAYSDTKENKQNIKTLDKRLSEISKSGIQPISVKLSYNSTTDIPSMIQYYCGDDLICTLK